MLLTQTLDKLDALGLFGMVLGLREQLESNQYLNLSFDERLGLLVDREAETRDSRRLALRLKAAKLRQEATVEDLDFCWVSIVIAAACQCLIDMLRQN